MAATIEGGTTTDVGSGAVTVASLAKGWAMQAPGQIAMREKDFGIWKEYNWAQTWDLVETAAHALLATGVDVGDRVAIHSEDRPEWVILDLAAVAVRGVCVGLYPTSPTAEVDYLVGDCSPKVFFAEDQEREVKYIKDIVNKSTGDENTSGRHAGDESSAGTGAPMGAPSGAEVRQRM